MPADPRYTTYGPQPTEQSNVSGIAKFGLGATALGTFGFLKGASGKRNWNTIYDIVRGAEEVSPSGILKTFKISELTSTLRSFNEFEVPSDILHGENKYSQYLKNIFGANIKDLSLRPSVSGGIFGEVVSGGKVVGYGLPIVSGTQTGGNIADYFARVTGTELGVSEGLGESILRQRYRDLRPEISFNEWAKAFPPTEREQQLILGAPLREEIKIGPLMRTQSTEAATKVAKTELVGNIFRAKAAADIGRLNRLLASPVELPVVGPLLQKIPLIQRLAVKPGTAAEMTMRYMGKATAIGLGFTALQYYDYLRSKNDPSATVVGAGIGGVIGGIGMKRLGMKFDAGRGLAGAAIGLFTALSPRFEYGLFHGAASYVADADVIRAKASGAFGMREAINRQEEVTPGLISPATALGFGFTGALALGVEEYGSLLNAARKAHTATPGAPLADVMADLRAARATRIGDYLWDKTKAGKFIAEKVPGGKKLSKIRGPMGVGFLAGVAAWTLFSSGMAAISGNPRAAIPGLNLLVSKETPEELRAQYSGEKEVPVRKGRFWEFGRCLLQHAEIITEFGIFKEAKDIKIEDKLLSSDGSFYNVLNIWERDHSGLSYSIYSALDKNIPTRITENHVIPILTKENTYNFEIVEKEAKDIKVGEYVQIPIPKLKEDTLIIETEKLIKTGLYLIDKESILPAQLNWYSKKIQRAKGSSIPREIKLTPELGRLFGYFLAEGNLSYKNDIPNMIETVHAKSERWIVDDIISICEKEFNITPTVRFKTTGKKTKEGCWIVRICSSLLARIYFELFYKGDRRQDKIFPQIFMSAPKNFKEEVIEGYWRGDGHLEGKAKVISSCRKDLLLKTQTILLSLGFYPTIDAFESNDYKGRYKIRWHQFAKLEGRGCRNLFKRFDDKLFVKIQKIEVEEYDGTVYDFEVDHPSHLFVAGTFLVHNSSYQGGKIDYFRQSFMARLKTRAYEKGMYGSEEDYWAHNPVLHPLQALFGSDEWKYWYERKYQYERPEVLSSTYFEEVPFFGPALAATLGQLIKPRKMIRPEEWNYGGGEYAYRKDIRGEGEPAYELGGLPQGAPLSPDVGTQVFNQLNYRRREAIGLAGYAEESIATSLTGRAELFAPPVTMGTMGRETGGEYWLFRHMNLGGGAGMTEAVRRFIPKTPYHWQEYNPLMNNLPSWIPGNTYLDLKYGNPLDKLPEGELRLPGSGFAASNPEVEGVAPEDYPIGYRVKILGDVAMYTDEYRASVAEAKRQWKLLTEGEKRAVVQTEEQVKAKKEKNFEEYKYNPESIKTREVTVSQVLSPRHVMTNELGGTIVELQGVGAIRDMDAAKEFALDTLHGQKISIISPAIDARAYDNRSVGPTLKAAAIVNGQEYGQAIADAGLANPEELKGELRQARMSSNERFAGRLTENVLHGIETPIDYLTPFAPVQKFISQRSAVEEYAATMAIGTDDAAWNKPMEDFLLPAINMARYSLGSKAIPEATQRKRDIDEYFDMLAWTKARKLENAYAEEGKYGLAVRYQQAAQRTVFGTDVFGSPVAPMRALPRYEKDFFSAFVGAQTNEERAEIMRLIPENERRIYLSQWLRQEESAAYVKKKAGQSEEKDKAIIETSQRMRRSEGFGYSDEQERRWYQETGGQVPFDDWLREQKALEYFSTHSLPDPSWIGWNPAVDMEDLKLKYVQMNGLDPRAFDLWQGREASMARKPYINEETIAQMQQNTNYKEVSYLKENTNTLSKMYNGSRTRYTSAVGYNKPQYDITISDSRDSLVEQAFNNLGVGV